MKSFPLNFLTLPVWWYTTGLNLVWRWYRRRTSLVLQATGLIFFFRHMNEPLYQDYTKSGVIISFFVRIFVLLYKALVSGLSLVVYGLVPLVYICLLPAVIIMIIFQLLNHV